MMVSTRSKTTQTHLEDFATTSGTKTKKSNQTAARKSKPKTEQKDLPSKKRKAPETSSDKPTAKRGKAVNEDVKRADSAQEDDSSTVLINRAPVLHLWAACVTRFLYPSLSWPTCLSAGSAISTICAVAKGRSVGTISERDDSEAAQRKRQEVKREQKDFDQIHVMQFDLKLKDDLAMVGGEKKGKPADEEGLKKKFGDDKYEQVKKSFEDALDTWQDDEEELSRKGFKFYEKFRPTVKSGQKGWGRKGELSLDTIQSVVKKE